MSFTKPECGMCRDKVEHSPEQHDQRIHNHARFFSIGRFTKIATQEHYHNLAWNAEIKDFEHNTEDCTGCDLVKAIGGLINES